MMNQVDRRRSDFEHEFNKRVQTKKNRKYVKQKTFEKNIQPYLVVEDSNSKKQVQKNQRSNTKETQFFYVKSYLFFFGVLTFLLLVASGLGYTF